MSRTTSEKKISPRKFLKGTGTVLAVLSAVPALGCGADTVALPEVERRRLVVDLRRTATRSIAHRRFPLARRPRCVATAGGRGLGIGCDKPRSGEALGRG